MPEQLSLRAIALAYQEMLRLQQNDLNTIEKFQYINWKVNIDKKREIQLKQILFDSLTNRDAIKELINSGNLAILKMSLENLTEGFNLFLESISGSDLEKLCIMRVKNNIYIVFEDKKRKHNVNIMINRTLDKLRNELGMKKNDPKLPQSIQTNLLIQNSLDSYNELLSAINALKKF